MSRRLVRRLRPRGLLAQFSLLSLLAVAALGIVLGTTLHGQIRQRALGDAAQLAQGVARFGIQPQLSPTDLRRGVSPEAVASLDALLRAGYASTPVQTLTVWNRRGRAVYSNDHAVIGRRSPRPAALHGALAGRRSAVVASTPAGRQIDVYVPLRFGAAGPPAGAFEVRLAYAPTAAAIRSDTRRLYLIVTVGLLVLYAALYRIAARVSRTLRRFADDSAHQARHDELTGLPNRTRFYERVGEAIAAARDDGSQVAVMLVDLDHFKEVNDTLGHHSGDDLLRQAARRLAGALRDSDVLARLGGDEFAVLLPLVADAAAARGAAERLGTMLEEPFDLEGLSIHIDASIGIAVFPEHGRTADDLLQRADVAMYQAKRGSGRFEVYESAADPYSPSRLAMVAQLRQALTDGGIELHYQPKADLRTGRVTSVEALARWRTADGTLVPPGEFIPLAERTGLIAPLTRVVLDAAIAQCATWEEEGLVLAVAVNLSARTLGDPELPRLVGRLLDAHGVAPARLRLEITEGSIMEEPDRALEVLRRLDAMGVELSIDDFGTGYSSLAYLSQLPVSELKIDRSFVSHMRERSSDAFIVRATIDLGRSLGLQVVAEGVEDEQTWSALSALGCDVAQGYFLSRPIPPEELAAWLLGSGLTVLPDTRMSA